MNKEEKSLLLIDLSARLFYHVRCKIWLKDGTTEEGFLDLEHNYKDVLLDAFYYNKIKDIKPYLRSMDNMTEEEKEELLEIVEKESDIVCEQLKNNDCGIKEGKYHFNSVLELYFLLSHHFDFRGLIPKGLALEAPEGMYN